MTQQTNGQFGAMPNAKIIIGAAGTGKTQKILELTADMAANDKSYVVVAYTNRAAKVLRERGIPASTIHKTLYESRKKDPEEYTEVMIPVFDPTTRLPQRDEKGQIIYGIEEEPVWEFAFKEDAFDASDTLIIDEASLIPSTMWRDIHDKWPGLIYIVGDHNQLPPVEMGDEDRRDERWIGYFHRAAQTPDIDLGGNENNRRVKNETSALPIIYEHIYAHRNPQGHFPDIDVEGQYNYIDLTRNTLLDSSILPILESADIVVTWKNDECVFINDLIRQRRARSAGLKHTPYPRAGDKILAKRHYYKTTVTTRRYWDKEQGCQVEYEKEEKEQLVMSGEEYVIASVTSPDAKNNVIWVLLEGVRDAVPLSTAHIDGGRANKALSPITWDYAYAITCHKAQGSGWKTVVVVDSYCMPKDAQRWRYTAATRASEHVIVIRSGISFDKRKLVGHTVDLEPPAPPSENKKRLRDILGARWDMPSNEVLNKYRVK